jgi:hypothetical protein
LNTPAIRALFLEALESSREQFSLFVYGYVVMPEHIICSLANPAPARWPMPFIS